MPPRLTATLVRRVYAGFFGVLSLTFVNGRDPVGYVLAALCAVLAVRGLRLGFICDREQVVVRNLFVTRRVPLSAVNSFGIRYGLADGPTLCVERQDGSRLKVTAYPMTRIPRVASRRCGVVDQLNGWLEQQRKPRP